MSLAHRWHSAMMVGMRAELSPGNPAIWFEEHGTVFGLSMAAGLFFVGYVGLTWIYRRQFYRRKLADPFPTFFMAWRTRMLEGYGGLFFLGCLCLSPLCFIAGVVEWLDG